MALSPLLLRCLQPLAATPPLHLALQGLGSSLRSLAGVAGSAEKLEKSFSALREAMAEAVASAEYVGPSANQLMLETDPAARGPREQYELHYAEMALSQLLAALEMKHNLAEQMGASQLELRLKHEKMAVLVAECQLWRDRTAAIIASVRRKQEANEISCDD